MKKKKEKQQTWTLKEIRRAWRLYLGVPLCYKFVYALKRQKRELAAQQASRGTDG